MEKICLNNVSHKQNPSSYFKFVLQTEANRLLLDHPVLIVVDRANADAPSAL